MRSTIFLKSKSIIILCIALLSITASQAQIDFARDTISRATLIGARNTYLNNLRGSGKKATERINLPVDKVKSIMDACAANGISEVKVVLITLRAVDVARYRQMNPGSTASDNDIIGSQLLVIRVPKRAFPEIFTAKIISRKNLLMTSLLGAGLVMMDTHFSDLPPAAGDVSFSFGSICPPPLACDDGN